MKILLAALAFVSCMVLSPVVAATLPVSVQHPLVVEAPEGWGAVDPVPPATNFPFFTSRLVALGERNAVILVTVLDQNHPEFDRPAVLKTILKGDYSIYAMDDAAHIVIKEVPIYRGIGFYASFIDPTLIEKPIKRDVFKTVTPIILSIGTEYLIKATILCDDLDGRDFKEALAIVSSISGAKR